MEGYDPNLSPVENLMRRKSPVARVKFEWVDEEQPFAVFCVYEEEHISKIMIAIDEISRSREEEP